MPTPDHPSWCADYRCTAVHPTGEHRSAPKTLTGSGGRLGAVVSVVRRRDRRTASVELRLWVPLRAVDDAGQEAEVEALTRMVAAAIDRAERSR